MVSTRFFVTTVAAASADTINLSFSDCGSAGTHAKITGLTPATIEMPGKATIVGSGALDSDQTGAHFELKVKKGIIPFVSGKGNICEDTTIKLPLGTGSFTVKGLDCPAKAGDVSVEVDLDVLSSDLFDDSNDLLDIHIEATADDTGDQVICLDVAASMAKEHTLETMADHINSLGASWTAAPPSRFGNFEDVKQVLGTIMKGQPGYTEEGLEAKSYEGENDDIPAEFDVRTAFPDCAEVSGNIRDQSSCGSCWAFGSTEAFNDRHCIATGDKTKFSVEDTTANCGFLQCFSMGCNGGQPGQAWNWFKNTGVVTGGDYTDIGSGDTCAPYSLAPCAHHVPASAEYPACPSDEYPTPSLSKCSESGYSKAYNDDKIKATGSYSLSGIKNIQADMVKYGSATAAFTVYSDFPTYKSGVYKHTSGSQLGGHAVKLLGWGTENGEDYWLVANSWNEQWGDHGTFKIARGNNECGIEGQVSAGTAGSVLI